MSRVVAPRLDPLAAEAVAAAHLDAPHTGGTLCKAAYERLVVECDRLFDRLTNACRPVRIVFTICATPYDDASELIGSIREGQMLAITSAACDLERRHPAMGCEIGGAYDRFRAVHDVLGRARLRAGFDRDGEYSAWRFQERFHSLLARRALATELHAEHSVRWTTCELPEHKAFLLDERLIARARAGHADDTRQQRDYSASAFGSSPRTGRAASTSVASTILRGLVTDGTDLRAGHVRDHGIAPVRIDPHHRARHDPCGSVVVPSYGTGVSDGFGDLIVNGSVDISHSEKHKMTTITTNDGR